VQGSEFKPQYQREREREKREREREGEEMMTRAVHAVEK
jgi:hypothetical protein